ncbi:TadE/TadG family type IV pilus assembly protein [Tardiphaga sp.]|uniref:TadE/TadG family type IV pilus assembly protein n=1 Tax=Tardiphaga sp. TaxID=1926292 RepID=UPI00263886B8|nr:TadE/TadG family type IV pilus assembly protein [Tardiphaga sp.]MDB5618651.1 TadE family protein [Tardiphaga sp.]
MLLPIATFAAPGRLLRRFFRNRRGSAAVEFAIIAPVFFAMIFAIIETALVFFAGQVLETAVQDTGRAFFTSTTVSKTDYETAICNRIKVLMDCTKVRNDVQTYAAGTVFTIADPIDSSGKFVDSFSYNPPASTDTTSTVVVRSYYQWPLFVTGLGYNIANVNRGGSNSSRLLTATAAYRPQ